MYGAYIETMKNSTTKISRVRPPKPADKRPEAGTDGHHVRRPLQARRTFTTCNGLTSLRTTGRIRTEIKRNADIIN
jgi:hypothetical protein